MMTRCSAVDLEQTCVVVLPIDLHPEPGPQVSLTNLMKILHSRLFQAREAACDVAFGVQSAGAHASEQASKAQPKLLQRLTALETAAHVRAMTVAAFEKAKASAEEAERFAAAQEAAAQAAADAANALKVYRAWDPKVGEYDACPQEPQPGQVLRYFDTENGKRAAQQDPLLQDQVDGSRKALPPRPDASAASTVFGTPGVYRASARSGQEPAEMDVGGAEYDGAGALDESWQEPVWQEQYSTHASTRSASPRSRAKKSMHSTHAKPTSPARTAPSSVSPARSHAVPARARDKLPAFYKQGHASAELNIEVLQREYETMKLTNTASAAQVRARGRDGAEFVLGCAALDFGAVPRGAAVTKKVPLQNVSLGAARFAVDRVAPPLKVAYPHAPVPVGLKVPLAVTFEAGAGAEAGPWEGEVVVRSAFNVLRCPVHATVVEGAKQKPQPDAVQQQQSET
jgi:Flagellar-associated PapD-like